MMKPFKEFLVTIAVVSASFQMPSMGAATVTASKNYVDRNTTLHPYSNGAEQVGYFLGTQTNKVLASKEYVDNSIPAAVSADLTPATNYTDSALGAFAATGAVARISDGTNTIGASGNVYAAATTTTAWNFTSPVAGISILEPVRYYAEGSSVDSWVEWNGAGWYCYALYEGADYTTSFSVFMVGDANADRLEDVNDEIYFTRRVAGKMYLVGKLALTNDIPSVVTADLTPATNYANQVGALVAVDATNYTDAVAAEFEDGLRSPQYASNSGHADYAVELYGEMTERSYTATDLIRESTNAALTVADAKISTNNAAFVSAVLAVPLTGADAGDLAEIAEYGGYGTVGAAILALIAGLAALKRRVTSAETTLAQKASLSDLPYRLVVPGEWEFSGSGYDPDSTYRLTEAEESGGIFVYALYIDDQAPSIVESQERLMSVVFELDGVTATRASLPGHLLDRAVNAVSVTGDTTLTLPELVNAGKSRDLLVRLTVSADSAVTFSAPTGETITWDDAGSPTATYEAGTHLLRFTEVAQGVFHFTDLGDGGSIDPAVLNGKLEATSAAPAFDPTKTYSVGEYVTYEGVLYECSTAVTTAGAWTGSTNWTATDMTSPDATLDLMADGRLRLVSADGDVLWMQGYGLASASSVTLSCDKVNFHAFAAATAFDAAVSYSAGDVVAYDGVVYVFTAAHAAGAWTGSDATVYAVALEMPTAPSGKVGDFVLDVDNTANASASVTAILTGAGTAFDVFTPKGVNLSTDILTFAGGEQCELYFTMTAFGTAAKPAWKVVKQIVEKQEFGS